MGLFMACEGGLHRILTGFTKSTDRPSWDGVLFLVHVHHILTPFDSGFEASGRESSSMNGARALASSDIMAAQGLALRYGPQ